MDISQILIAIGLTLVAGLSTGIGGFISFSPKRVTVVCWRQPWDCRQE